MADNEQAELTAYIDDVIGRTSAGKMEWTVINPTTFSYDPPSPHPGRIILQRVEKVTQTAELEEGKKTVDDGKKTVRQAKEIGYVFQVLEFPSTSVGGPKTALFLNSFDNPKLKDKFQSLFEMIESAFSKKRWDFLRSILPE
jgi:hypothetical protein